MFYSLNQSITKSYFNIPSIIKKYFDLNKLILIIFYNLYQL